MCECVCERERETERDRERQGGTKINVEKGDEVVRETERGKRED